MQNQTEKLQQQEALDAFYSRCMIDYEYFAKACLKIKTKSSGLQPLRFNRAQQYLHQTAEAMMKQYGMVRIIIVKARQQGLSTYVEGRAYWRTVHTPHFKTFILTHEAAATKNLFGMAKRFHAHCPPDLRPITKRSNAIELVFNEIDSEYAVGTAKTGDTGRSSTVQFFHGSEVAYWRCGDEISSGLMQGIPNESGTESYLESTACGAGGFFHNQWQNACNPGDKPPATWNGYWRVFIPWFWDPTYRRPCDDYFEMSLKEQELALQYGLDAEQINWRRLKIAEMKNDLAKFQRDYPANPSEAFNASLANVLIESDVVIKAMRAGREHTYEPMGRIILGVDVAREGNDDTCLVLRQGRVIVWYRRLSKSTTYEVAAAVLHAVRQYHVDHVVIDSTGGYGAGVYDVLMAQGLGRKLTGINFAQRAIDEIRYKNKRAEMYCCLRDWLNEGAAIPDKEELLIELCAITYKYEPGKDRLVLERKDEIKKRIGKSTDISDAAALTFCVNTFLQEQGAGDSFDPIDYFGVV